ncbi:hypothetical protein PhiH1_130 [Halobacterium phage phiH]|uniref:Uncharacterized protein n=1 Tax=Halobacterium phage phiH TaxID=169684 RepID=A0A3G1ZKT2_BPPHH|nr:hypothetical protein JR051_gp27 [Halobacterium phage phiH]AYM00273.1 hypothetical protein PhiH1_130 [Halobacterium phage phiH]
MSLDRFIDIGYGCFQGGFVVAVLTGATRLALCLLALATVIGVIGVRRGGSGS